MTPKFRTNLGVLLWLNYLSKTKLKFLIFGKTIRLEPLMPIRICSIFLVVITTTKKDKERNNREIMAEIKAIYEEQKHRYGYHRITV